MNKNQEVYHSCRYPHKEWGIPALHQFPQPRVAVPRKEIFTTSGYENQQTVAKWDRRQLKLQALLLKSLQMALLIARITGSELQFWDSSLKGALWDVWGGTKLSDLRVRAREAIFSQTKMLTDFIVSLLSPPHPGMQTQEATTSKFPSTWITPVTPPWWFPETPPPNLGT